MDGEIDHNEFISLLTRDSEAVLDINAAKKADRAVSNVQTFLRPSRGLKGPSKAGKQLALALSAGGKQVFGSTGKKTKAKKQIARR
jgi:hypothetical protein